MKTCPDCLGKKVIQLFTGSAPCELCKQTGSVAEPSDVVPDLHVGQSMFAPNDPLVVTPPLDRNSDFYSFNARRRAECRVREQETRWVQFSADANAGPIFKEDGSPVREAFSHYANDGYTGRSILMVAKEDGLLYQADNETKQCRCLGSELVCMVDGYSKREKWADLAFYPGEPYLCRQSIVRFNGESTMQAEACLCVLHMGNCRHYKFRPFLMGDKWEITVEGVREQQAQRVGDGSGGFYGFNFGRQWGKTASFADFTKFVRFNYPNAQFCKQQPAIHDEIASELTPEQLAIIERSLCIRPKKPESP